MKKRELFTLVLLFTLVFAATSYADSSSLDVTFYDNNKYWGEHSGWGAGQAWSTDVPNGGWDGNNLVDVIGDPEIKGGTASFNLTTGNLTRITFNYSAPNNDWRMLAPGNLFINVLNETNDTIWDYVVTTMGKPGFATPDGSGAFGTVNGSSKTLVADNYNLYNISTVNNGNGISAQRGVNDSSYIVSGADNTGYWAGWYLRNGHPIGIKSTVLEGLTPGFAYFSGFPGTIINSADGTRSSYYEFGVDGLDIDGKDIIIGWEMTCANDVIYANKIDNPVPEPATMLLLGLGLLGIGAIKRKL